MDKIRWGILSTAKIGRKSIIPAAIDCAFAKIHGIASRDLEIAKKVSRELDIPRTYASYDDLLADTEIQAVYIPLPNHMHVEWIHKCLDAGKHVLCEKPIALVSEQILALKDKAENLRLKVGEAFMVRTSQQWIKVNNLIQDGAIGELKSIHGFFSYFNNDPGNIRNVEKYGGGALWDIGCYLVMQSRFIFNQEPEKVFALSERDPEFQIDRLFTGVLSFPSGTATFTVSTQLVPYQKMQFFGTKGMLELVIPFNAPTDEPCKINLHKGEKTGPTDVIEIPASNQYTDQMDAFSKAILENKPVPVSMNDSYLNTKVIEALFESEKSGESVSLIQ